MAQFSDLTAEQQATWYTFENDLRLWAGKQARLNVAAAALNTAYAAQIQAILAAFNTNQTIPNTSGLAGAASLNAGADTVAIVTQLQGILTAYNTSTVLQLWTRAAGEPNMTPTQ